MAISDTDVHSDVKDFDVSRSEHYESGAWRQMFAQLRAEAPIHFCPQSMFGPYWSVVRYADVAEIEGKPEIFSSSWEHGGITIFDAHTTNVKLPMFIAMDEPEHSLHRKTLAPAVTPSVMQKLTGPLRQRTASILDSLPVGETFDWVANVSTELTTQLLATLFDFPWEDRHLLPFWADWMASVDIAVDPALNAERERHAFEMAAYFKRLFNGWKAQPQQDNLLSLMAHSEHMSDLDDQHFLGTMALLVVGGNDTTRNSMSGLIDFIHRFPDQWAKVKADHSLIPTAVTETIRLQNPIAHMRRTALADTELHGQRISKGDKVILWYNSANRDETVFSDAETWNVTRDNSRRHLSFGYGIHRCLGARLAELQLQILIEQMLERNMNVVPVAAPVRPPSCFVQGIQTFDVCIEPS